MKTQTQNQKKITSNSVFVNIYEDGQGRFIGDTDYDTYQDAFDNRDVLSTYVETVKITRFNKK